MKKSKITLNVSKSFYSRIPDERADKDAPFKRPQIISSMERVKIRWRIRLRSIRRS